MSGGFVLALQVVGLRAEARDVLSVELAAVDGSPLLSATPGSHLDLELAPDLVRSYSLVDTCGPTYHIGVGLSANSRGGSSHVHQALRLGDRLRSSLPRNHFPLATNAARHVFVAGGIGITPLAAMARACQARGEDWALHYCARSRLRAAFLDDLVALGGRERIRTWFAEEDGAVFDAARHFEGAPAAGEHVYCCGPQGLMQAVAHATRHHPQQQVHFEWFAAPGPGPAPAAVPPPVTDAGFRVQLARSAMAFDVGPGETILACLEREGVDVPWSCREGLCGSCQTQVLAGEIDHRDMVLTAEEQRAGRTMMVCVSRARGAALTLDL